jgi:hypothetical protein
LIAEEVKDLHISAAEIELGLTDIPVWTRAAEPTVGRVDGNGSAALKMKVEDLRPRRRMDNPVA